MQLHVFRGEYYLGTQAPVAGRLSSSMAFRERLYENFGTRVSFVIATPSAGPP